MKNRKSSNRYSKRHSTTRKRKFLVSLLVVLVVGLGIITSLQVSANRNSKIQGLSSSESLNKKVLYNKIPSKDVLDINKENFKSTVDDITITDNAKMVVDTSNLELWSGFQESGGYTKEFADKHLPNSYATIEGGSLAVEVKEIYKTYDTLANEYHVVVTVSYSEKSGANDGVNTEKTVILTYQGQDLSGYTVLDSIIN